LIILEGKTGCRKKFIIQFIPVALFVPRNEDGHKLSHVLTDALNCHNSIGPDEFLSSIEDMSHNHFCDEINTSIGCSFVEKRMLNEFPGLKPKVNFIPTVNLLA
jgi:hypothetical protein